MKTRFFLITALLAFLAFGAFAQDEDREIVNLDGSVKTNYRMHAELEANGETYALLMPRFVTDDLPNGAKVSVEGYILEIEEDDEMCQGRGPQFAEGITPFVVTKITVGDEEIDLSAFERGPRGPRGGRDGDDKRGGRGNGRGGRR